jgi:NADPH2:quinone reductase
MSNNTVPAQMEAAVLTAYGLPAEALTHRQEPVPTPAEGEVLIEVHAAAVNPLDVASAAGYLGTPLPMIPGGDYAGVVVSDGAWKGREVWGSGAALGLAIGEGRPGTHARYLTLPESWLSAKPERLSMAEAGAVGRPYWVAWHLLTTMMDIAPGETALLIGGAGLVGQAATAIARWKGADVIVVDRRKPDGVDRFVHADTEDIYQAVQKLTDGQGVDLALDAIGNTFFEPTLRSLRFNGRMVGIFTPPDALPEVPISEIYNRQLHVTGLASVVIPGTEIAHIFNQLAPLFDGGNFKPPAITTWALTDAAQAYDAVRTGPRGVKHVLLPASDN